MGHHGGGREWCGCGQLLKGTIGCGCGAGGRGLLFGDRGGEKNGVTREDIFVGGEVFVAVMTLVRCNAAGEKGAGDSGVGALARIDILFGSGTEGWGEEWGDKGGHLRWGRGGVLGREVSGR